MAKSLESIPNLFSDVAAAGAAAAGQLAVSAVGHKCIFKEVKAGLACAALGAAAAALTAAIVAEFPSAGAATIAVIGAIAACIGAINLYVSALEDLLNCYDEHPDEGEHRRQQIQQQLDQLKKWGGELQKKMEELQRWVDEHI